MPIMENVKYPRYFILLTTNCFCSISGGLIRNPNISKHWDKYAGKMWVDVETPIKICKELKMLDGTTGIVIHGMTGNEMTEDLETGEIKEYVINR